MAGEAQGSEESIKSYLKEINKGPRAAHVVKVEKEEIEVKEGEKSFHVKWTSRIGIRNGFGKGDDCLKSWWLRLKWCLYITRQWASILHPKQCTIVSPGYKCML